MQKYILAFVWLVSLCSLPLTGRAQTAPLDSLTERKVIRTVGADMCRQLGLENAKKPLVDLSATEAQQLFVRLITSSAATSPELMAVFTNHPEVAQTYGQTLGKKIGLWLFQECAVSQPLFVKLSGQEASKQQALTPAEENLLQPMAADVCRDLEARQQKQDLKTLTAEQRTTMLQEVIQASMKTHSKELVAQYGTDIFLDAPRMKVVGTKLGMQMGSKCPKILLILADVK